MDDCFSQNFSFNLSNGTSNQSDIGNWTPNCPPVPTSIALISRFCWFITAIGSVGNFFVLVVFTSRYRILRSQEIFFANLAISDLLGSILLPTFLYLKLTKFDMEKIGVNGCKIYYFFELVFMLVSAWTLVLISFDRLIAVKCPLWRRSHPLKRKSLMCCIFTWILCGLFGLLFYFTEQVELEADPCYHACFRPKQKKNDLMNLKFTIEEAVPLILITFAHVLSIQEIRKQSRNPLIQIPEHEEHKRMKQNNEAIKLSLVIVIAFHVCNLPLCIYHYVMAFTRCVDDTTVSNLQYLTISLNYLMVICNCTNPFIYCRLHKQFRLRFRIFITACREQHELHHDTSVNRRLAEHSV